MGVVCVCVSVSACVTCMSVCRVYRRVCVCVMCFSVCVHL